MAKFEDLPTELISWIADYLGVGELADLTQTARKLYHVADPILYSRAKDVAYDPSQPHKNPLRCAAQSGNVGTIRKCIAAGFGLNMQLGESKDVEKIKTECYSRRVEALEGKRIWDKDALLDKTQGQRDDPDTLWDDAYDDPADFETSSTPPDNSYSRRTRQPNASSYPRPSVFVVPCTPRALHLAAIGGHDEAVEVLLDHGADIDAYAKNACDCPFYTDRLAMDHLDPAPTCQCSGNSALHLAICHFHESTVKLLLKRGASIQTAKRMLTPSFSALHTAAATGQAGLCAYLLDEGYVEDIEIHDGHSSSFGLTALYWAVYHGHWNTTVPALLERGTDINAKYASDLNDIPDIERLENDLDGSEESVEESSIIYDTFLCDACSRGHFDEALKLIRLGADVNKGRLLGDAITDTPLHVLCHSGGLERRPPFNPPIQLSKARDQSQDEDALRQLFEVLIQEGADIEAVAYEDLGYTPLHEAASNHFVVGVQALLAAGADVHSLSYAKSTPLLEACSCIPGYNNNPYSAAPHTRATNFDILPITGRITRDNGLSDGYCTIKLLLDHGSNINATGLGGNNALHLLCRNGYVRNESDYGSSQRVIRLLLDRGIDVSVRNDIGRTAFQEAFVHGFYSICNLLLRYQKATPRLTFNEVAKMAEALITMPNQEGWEMLLDLDTENHLASTSKFLRRLYNRLHLQNETSKAICAYLERRPPRLNAEEKGEILCLAIRQQHTRLIKHMLALKAPVNRPDQYNRTSLSNAVAVFPNDAGLAKLTQDLLSAGADLHFRPTRETFTTPLQVAIASHKTFAVERMLRHRPLRGDREAPKGVYLHAAVLHGPGSWEMVNMLLRSGAQLTELDKHGDTPLGCFLKTLLTPGTWVKEGQSSDKTRAERRRIANRVCATIRHLWTKDIDVRARNKVDKSIMSYLAAIKLYSGYGVFRVELANLVREQIKVVPADGCKGPERVTLEFHDSDSYDDLDVVETLNSDDEAEDPFADDMDYWLYGEALDMGMEEDEEDAVMVGGSPF